MRFKDKLKTLSQEDIWQEYCGFIDLSLQDYMYIQNRLMEEQLRLFARSELGKKICGREIPCTIEEFRQIFPLTRYEDYADVLLAKKAEMLPAEPMIWIETTWEGGFRPVKLAPYTRAILDTYKKNVLAIMMLSSSKGRGHFTLKDHDRILYGGAPLPYATGLLPSLLREEMDFEWLPDSNEHSDLSFGERIKKGFSMAKKSEIDYFFAIGSVASYITDNFARVGGGQGSLSGVSPKIALRYLMARLRICQEGGSMVPGDLFHLKGFMATGTDVACYKSKLKKAWGLDPIDIAAGTESTCMATETWEHNGMILFPDSCFYEFISTAERGEEERVPGYVPRTCRIDEVRTGEIYEIVISVLHGGAFMRYRIGDLYRCVLGSEGGRVPRFAFLDRTPDIIDIAGFTRITEKYISEVIERSRLPVSGWVACKDFSEEGVPYLHMYLELDSEEDSDVSVRSMLTEQLSLHFRFFDSDYDDLKKLLKIEPLKLEILKKGQMKNTEKRLGRKIRRMNPPITDIHELLDQRNEPVGPVLEGR